MRMSPVKALASGRVALAALALVALGADAPPPSSDAVIARARAFLGTEEALAAVQSVHFVGTYESHSADADQSGSIEMIFQKPFSYLATVTLANGRVETTGLDDYESWLRVQDPGEKPILTLMTKDQTKSLRINTADTLDFFEGTRRTGGTVTVIGDAEVAGVDCVKVELRWDEDTARDRYFDKSTGRLVLTETSHDRTQEEGEIIVDGVRFPRRVVSVVNPGTDTERTITVTFTSITLNESFPADRFAVPSISSLR